MEGISFLDFSQRGIKQTIIDTILVTIWMQKNPVEPILVELAQIQVIRLRIEILCKVWTRCKNITVRLIKTAKFIRCLLPMLHAMVRLLACQEVKQQLIVRIGSSLKLLQQIRDCPDLSSYQLEIILILLRRLFM